MGIFDATALGVGLLHSALAAFLPWIPIELLTPEPKKESDRILKPRILAVVV
jgi:hypothetical protein